MTVKAPGRRPQSLIGSRMSFRLVRKSVTLDDLEWRNSPYFEWLLRNLLISGAYCVNVVDRAITMGNLKISNQSAGFVNVHTVWPHKFRGQAPAFPQYFTGHPSRNIHKSGAALQTCVSTKRDEWPLREICTSPTLLYGAGHPLHLVSCHSRYWSVVNYEWLVKQATCTFTIRHDNDIVAVYEPGIDT